MSDESTREGGTESPAARYFKSKTKQADAALAVGGLAEVANKRRGRKPKARHDADDTPMDGWSSPLTSRPENEDPNFAYFYASEADISAYGHRGWVPEVWGPKCARPKHYFGQQVKGTPVTYKRLTLMRMPKARAEMLKRRDEKRVLHEKLMGYVLKQAAEATGGEFTKYQQTVTV